VRSAAERVNATMQRLVERYLADLERVSDEHLDLFLAELVTSVKRGATTYVSAYGRNNPVGGVFAHRLATMRMPVAMTPSRLERPVEAGDLLIAISGSGGTFEVIQRLSGARRDGLRTSLWTALADARGATLADLTVVFPGVIEPLGALRYSERQLQVARAPRPSESTFSFGVLLTLEAELACLMRVLGKREKDLVRTGSWQ